MGKRYYCDYCDKTMVASQSIIRTHNNGIVHQKLVQEHYQQYKDAETILAEESRKKPCVRFANGQCQFGSICRFSHYTREQIQYLRDYVASKNTRESEISYPSFIDLVRNLLDERSTRTETDGNTVMYDNNGVTHVFPWTYNSSLDSYGDDLPPSVKRIKIEDFNDAEIVSWG
ncbi:zinc finger matrin-type protein 5 [Anticarsia gemmatalis]|uniref:zinc finger matrin-type protein 5 n=1 Tax=Anticarsia gemmatalis TaxID=129554 RepID=UPI003F759E29